MADTTALRRDPELEARLIEEAREAVREGLVIPDEDVDRWLEDLCNGKPLLIPGAPDHKPSSR